MNDGYSPIVVKNKGDTRWIKVDDDHLERMLEDFYEYQVDITMGKMIKLVQLLYNCNL